MVNSRSLEKLELDDKAHEQKKIRLNVTVLEQTSNWLKKQGNASKLIDELVAAAMAMNHQPADQVGKLEELIRENEELKAKLSQLQSQQEKESSERQDHQVIRDRVLAGLKMGKQAPGYRSAVKALDRFIAEIQ